LQPVGDPAALELGRTQAVPFLELSQPCLRAIQPRLIAFFSFSIADSSKGLSDALSLVTMMTSSVRVAIIIASPSAPARGSRISSDPRLVSARIAAFVRAHHVLNDDPRIFGDHLAIRLFTAEERAQFSADVAEPLKFFDPVRAASCPDPESAPAAFMRAQSGPITLKRGHNQKFDASCIEAP
jgi:hypothetical protein